MQSDKQKHILVAVLDWGLGHATRCVPLIRVLLENHCKVSIAGSGSSLALLQSEFPLLDFYRLPSYGITYPKNSFFFLHLFRQAPRIFKVINEEHQLIAHLVAVHKFDAVISDNRYGCYSKEIKSVFITHQLNIQLPRFWKWGKKLVAILNLRMINRFSLCWVPDLENAQLSGKLSYTNDQNVKFIGSLSRFSKAQVEVEDGFIVAIISGPEPQREIFDRLLTDELLKLDQRSLIVKGLPHIPPEERSVGSVTIMSHVSATNLQELISKADVVIARSGYSTIMDLYTLKKKRIIFIPIPGQTEQEYLAHKLEKEGIAFTQQQHGLDIVEAIKRSKEYRGFESNNHRTNLLDEAIHELLHLI
jgi:uncharacterized protein (TIGR00661 family)